MNKTYVCLPLFAEKTHESYKIWYCKKSIKLVAIFLNHQRAAAEKVTFKLKHRIITFYLVKAKSKLLCKINFLDI